MTYNHRMRDIKDYTENYWVTIPAGEFTMGSNDEEREKPIHKVHLPEYKIARVPVTNEQWDMFLQDSNYNWEGRSNIWKNGLPQGKEKHPVVYVSWDDVRAFCQWAGVRLPTEAEWEKAARGVDTRKYPWGNQSITKDFANYDGSDIKDTTPVGNYPKGASPYGLLDMAGNVWEWCSSEYKSYPYDANDGRENTSNNNKVIRGGSWDNSDNGNRAPNRTYFISSYYFNFLGFRYVQ